MAVGGGVYGRCAGVGRGLGVGVARTGCPVAVAVGVGVGVPPCATVHAENSEVLLLGSVAVAVITSPDPTVTGKVTSIVALQLPSVVMSAEPTKVSPWPNPEEWHWALSKNSTRNVVFAVLFKL